jgi:glycosyltransferase involved in cell wall biosynthesis
MEIKPKTLCLTMIVKNEENILERCFDSIKDYIDFWIICDTGSTDNTKQFIINYFNKHKIKGELHLCEWKNFGLIEHMQFTIVKIKRRIAFL